jgi:hypothetical protein
MARGAPWLVSGRGRMKWNSPLARYSRAPLPGRGDPMGSFPAMRECEVPRLRGHDAVTVRRAGCPALAGPVTRRHVTWTYLCSAAAADGGRRRAGTRSYELTCELVGGRTSARDASPVGGLGAGGWRPALQVHRNTAQAVGSATTLEMHRPKQDEHAPDHRAGIWASGSTAIVRAGLAITRPPSAPPLGPAPSKKFGM